MSLIARYPLSRRSTGASCAHQSLTFSSSTQTQIVVHLVCLYISYNFQCAELHGTAQVGALILTSVSPRRCPAQRGSTDTSHCLDIDKLGQASTQFCFSKPRNAAVSAEVLLVLPNKSMRRAQLLAVFLVLSLTSASELPRIQPDAASLLSTGKWWAQAGKTYLAIFCFAIF